MTYKSKIADIQICFHTTSNNTKNFHKYRKFHIINLKAISYPTSFSNINLKHRLSSAATSQAHAELNLPKFSRE